MSKHSFTASKQTSDNFSLTTCNTAPACHTSRVPLSADTAALQSRLN